MGKKALDHGDTSRTAGRFEISPLFAARFRAFLMAAFIIAFGNATYTRNSAWHDLVSIWADAAKKNPNKARSHCNLGVALNKHARPDEARREFEIAIGLDPDYADAHYNLGNSYFAQERLDEASKEYQRALTLKPDFPAARYNFAALLEMMINRDPADPATYNNLAAVYGLRGNYEAALEASKKALSLDPKDKTAYNNMGLAYASLGRHTEAISFYKRSLDIDPGYGEARYNLALAYLATNQKASALQEYGILKDMNRTFADKLMVEIRAR